jgi:hypothetical protein
VRSILLRLFLVVVAPFSAPAGVLYSFSQPASSYGSISTSAIDFDFTAPSLLTSTTLIPGGSINSPGVRYAGLDLSILSVLIDPGLKNGTPWIGEGIPFLGIRMGWGSQVVLSEGMCFVPDHYGCTASPAAQIFDHFGTYANGDIQLTIAPTDVLQTATPEPGFQSAFGLLALLLLLNAYRSCSSTCNHVRHAEYTFPDHSRSLCVCRS